MKCLLLEGQQLSIDVRVASRGSVLSWQTPLHHRYSALKPIKYHTLSLEVSNVGVLEQATAYISLVTLHSTITQKQRYCLVLISPAQWHETIHVLNTRKWYCIERMCFWISSTGRAVSNAVRISYTATHTQELFCNILLHGERTVSNHDHFVLQFQAKFYLPLYTYRVMTSKFRLSSASLQVTWVRLHWNYIFISNFSYWKARQLT